MYRTHNLGELRIENVNQEVELSAVKLFTVVSDT